ncbi:hypothetical protein K470DRAFT_277913 [Piedraia hortae CBS 480.64]|uniref:t-SNARE coiled-coil homology domain-containing protein n=1 Tax=Piedraia hortae CBS 480.64 TaxID=1314780 RepID=A0A6A7BW52_9PEZI|nr:hypothetical protein K470DRAFT_277913 [Piedraia hortae CBS 480.64]
MASRFQRDKARNALFSGYDDSPVGSRPSSTSPQPPYPLAAATAYPPPRNGFGAHPTNTSRGYSNVTTMDELESQKDHQVSEMTQKVRMLKEITVAIGTEIRDSTALAEKMNDSFESTRHRVRGTMRKMLRMADKTGVGWRVWFGFFVCVFLLFVYVWLF